jgi:biotin carboxyl carrier protein
MSLTDEDVREILRIIDESPLQEIRIRTEGFDLHVVKSSGGDTASWTPRGLGVREAASSPANDGLKTIGAPMLGTFYRAEAPGAKPFVEPGSRVEPDTIVCIIEVMKMMNSVPAGLAGTIVEVCPENAELVEFGAPLFRVGP